MGVCNDKKNYQELIKDRIYLGGADDVVNVLGNEKVDTVFDLRAESPNVSFNEISVHCPIIDDADQQDTSIKNSIEQVVDAYNKGKNIYFHCQGGSNRTEQWRLERYLH